MDKEELKDFLVNEAEHSQEDVDNMSAYELFEAWCIWEGIQGSYPKLLKNVIEAAYEVDLNNKKFSEINTTTLKQVGYVLTGTSLCSMWGGGQGYMKMDERVVSLTSIEEITNEVLKDNVNDGQFGVESIDAAIVDVWTLYEGGYREFIEGKYWGRKGFELTDDVMFELDNQNY